MKKKSQKKFKVGIRRIVEAVREYKVEAGNESEAEDKAIELARDDNWSSSSDYDTEYIRRV